MSAPVSMHTPGPWGVEQTADMLWVGPLREGGHKVDEVVVGLNIDRELTVTAALRQYRNACLIAAAPELLDALVDLLAQCAPSDATEEQVAAAHNWIFAKSVSQARRAIAKAQGDA